MTLPAVSPGRVLHTDGRYRTRSYVAGNAVAPRLQVMRNRRRGPRKVRLTQTGGRDTLPVDLPEESVRDGSHVALHTTDLLRVGGYRRIVFQSSCPAAFAVACHTFNLLSVYLDRVWDLGR